MDVALRLLRPDDDAGAVGQLVLDSYRALPGYPPEDDYEAELLDVARRAQEAEVVVAELDGLIVGCLTYVPDHTNPHYEFEDPTGASFRMLAVAQAAQGRGIGEALVRWCIDRARADGKACIVIHSGAWMVAAHRLYGRLGFVRRPELDWIPVPEIPLYAFRLDL
jgi:GNAT superfamily N-acetyltransferase